LEVGDGAQAENGELRTAKLRIANPTVETRERGKLGRGAGVELEEGERKGKK
jgi:hypothetical protein